MHAKLILSKLVRFAWILSLVGCGDPGSTPPAKPPPAEPPPVEGDFLIKEVYYTGSAGIGGVHYFHDQFVEIYNASNGTLYADGLLIGDASGPAGEINPGQEPSPFQDDQDHVYLNSVWQIPGSGADHPVPPGGSIVMAQDGTNHQPDSVLDHSDADFETYNEREDGKDIDWPLVPNLVRVHFTGGFDWLLPVFGGSVVIFRAEDTAALSRVDIPEASFLGPRIKVPNKLVVDAFEALQDVKSEGYKRIPRSLDAGFVYASGTYTGESARRKVSGEIDGRKVLIDTNDSSADFEIIGKPTPREF